MASEIHRAGKMPALRVGGSLALPGRDFRLLKILNPLQGAEGIEQRFPEGASGRQPGPEQAVHQDGQEGQR